MDIIAATHHVLKFQLQWYCYVLFRQSSVKHYQPKSAVSLLSLPSSWLRNSGTLKAFTPDTLRPHGRSTTLVLLRSTIPIRHIVQRVLPICFEPFEPFEPCNMNQQLSFRAQDFPSRQIGSRMASPRPRPDLEGPFFSTCHGQSHPRLGVPWLRKPLNGEDMDAMMGWWDDGIWMDMGTLREQPSSFLFTKCREKSSLFPRYARP